MKKRHGYDGGAKSMCGYELTSHEIVKAREYGKNLERVTCKHCQQILSGARRRGRRQGKVNA